MTIPTVTAAPDGGAELRLVIRLDWEHVAELGLHASKLASEVKRPVTLDEAVSHQLASRFRPVAPAHGAAGTVKGSTPATPLPGAAVEPPRQAPATVGKPAAPASLESGTPVRPAAVAPAQSPVRQAAAPAQTDDKPPFPLAAAG
ncbi:hypothetical protein [Kitasatospora cystarginea]